MTEVEKVARSIAEPFISANKAAGHPTNLTWKDFIKEAKAAIAAINRERT